MSRTCSYTPRRSRIGTFIGSSDSPMWKRGWRAFSSSSTRWPRRARSAAAVEPAGPPPTTSTSVSMESRADGSASAASVIAEWGVLGRSGDARGVVHDSGRTGGGCAAAREAGSWRPFHRFPGSPMPAQTDDERDLAELLVESLNLEDVVPEEIDPEAPLFNAGLGLDSI